MYDKCPHQWGLFGVFFFWFVYLLVVFLLIPTYKAVNRGKGLLPDPTAMQLFTGLNNPATLKMLLNTLSQGHKQGKQSSS